MFDLLSTSAGLLEAGPGARARDGAGVDSVLPWQPPGTAAGRALAALGQAGTELADRSSTAVSGAASSGLPRS